jgi:hypothetical protein
MNRTTVLLPFELKGRALKRAHERGISFGEFLREALSEFLESTSTPASKTDTLFQDDALFRGKTPASLSSDTDRFLYEET